MIRLIFILTMSLVSLGGVRAVVKNDDVHQSGQGSDKPITINLSKPPSSHKVTFKLSDLMEDIEYIPLETSPASFMSGRADMITLTKDYIFIHEVWTIFQFRRDGKFVRKVNRSGRGPNEGFARISCFDDVNKRIYIYEHYTHNIMVFDFDGKFINRLKDPFDNMVGSRVGSMFCDEKGFLLLLFENAQGNMMYKYAVLSPALEVVHKEPNYDLCKINKRVIESTTPFLTLYKCKDNLIYWNTHSDTIFKINADYTCSPSFVINLPNRLTLEDKVKAGAYLKEYSSMQSKNDVYLIAETDRYLYIYIVSSMFNHDNNKTFMTLYNKETKELKEYGDVKMINDFDGGMTITRGLYGDTYVTELLDVMDARRILTPEHFASTKVIHPEKRDKLKKMVSGLKDEDNPIVVIYKRK